MSRWGVGERMRQAVAKRLGEQEAEWPYADEDFESLDLHAGSRFEAGEPTSVHGISPFIDEMEEMICSAATLPMTSKALVDQDRCLAALDVIRANWPLEVLEAQRVLAKEGQVLEQAEADAEETRQRAKRQAAIILDQSQLVRMAEVRAQELVEAAEQDAARIRDRAQVDVRDVYEGLERELDLLMRDIKQLVGTRLSKLNR